MQPFIRILVIVAFLGILVSLGSALYHLTRGSRAGEGSSAANDAASGKMVRALTIRIGLSIGLFLLLMLAWYAGLIQPHGIPTVQP
jgi:hypothetical protein